MRHFAALLVLAIAATIGALPCKADDYPSRPVRIIVPFGAGGPTDVYTRAIAEELRKALHQTFVMENKPGAGTTIGTYYVAKADPTVTRC
jgi:tripartite-type tricarboxylate transporter receptor subunit TctC